MSDLILTCIILMERHLSLNIWKKKKNAGMRYNILQTDYMTEDLSKIGITKHISKRICQYMHMRQYEKVYIITLDCQDVI